MSKSVLYAIIGVLVALAIVLALGLERERAKTSGITIGATNNGLSI